MTLTLSWRARAALLISSAVVYVFVFWPAWWVRDTVLRTAGHPAYSGLWKFLPHLLLYSTLPAIVAAIAWVALARAGAVEWPPLGKGDHAAMYASGGAIAAIVLTLGAFVALGQASAIRWIRPDPWSIAGNLFSNFYEEFIFRGFLLSALTRVIRFWPAAIATSALWAATHTQYPLWLRVVIFIIGVILAWVMARAKTLWAAWGAHMIMDVVLDSLIG